MRAERRGDEEEKGKEEEEGAEMKDDPGRVLVPSSKLCTASHVRKVQEYGQASVSDATCHRNSSGLRSPQVLGWALVFPPRPADDASALPRLVREGWGAGGGGNSQGKILAPSLATLGLTEERIFGRWGGEKGLGQWGLGTP